MKIKVLFIAIVSLMMFSVDAYSQCKGKCRNGKGIYTFEDGEVYDGQFVDGQFEGKGTYSYNSGAKYTVCQAVLAYTVSQTETVMRASS